MGWTVNALFQMSDPKLKVVGPMEHSQDRRGDTVISKLHEPDVDVNAAPLEPVASPWHTILTGAGISMGAPSSLPSGDHLADLAWRLLTQESQVDSRAHAEVRKRIRHGHLRLEQVLNVMMVGTAGVPLETLVTVYEAVDTQAFNYLHARLAEFSSVQHFTVNMDRLLEVAAAAMGVTLDVTHLHGRFDQPETIITTISQYLDQLEPELAEKFAKALLGRKVLVTGYSARDRDIHWLLVRYPPREVTWLVYPWAQNGTPDLRREQELSAEAIRLLDTLRANGSTHVAEVRMTTEYFLDGILPQASDRTSILRPLLDAQPSPSDLPLPPHARNAYAAVPDWRRTLAVAAVFFDQGLPSAARDALRSIVLPSGETGGRVALAKMTGRILRRENRPWAAIWAFLRPSARHYRGQLKAVANETSAALGSTVLWPVADLADLVLLRFAERGGHHRAAVQVGTRIAQHRSSRGNLTTSERRLRQLLIDTPSNEIDLGTRINTLTWRADSLKVQGRVQEAQALLRDDLDDREYANATQKAFVDWKLLELNLVVDGPAHETVRSLAELAQSGRDALGPVAYCWLQLTRIGASGGNCLRESDWEETEQIARRRPDTEHYLHLQLAELSRYQGDFDSMKKHLRSARLVERNRAKWRGSETGRLAANLIQATARAQTARQPGDRAAAVRELDRVERALRRMGANLPADRALRNATIARRDGALDDLWQIAM
jgi:hypothetical protein